MAEHLVYTEEAQVRSLLGPSGYKKGEKMGRISKGFLLLAGMFGFMIIFPTTFWVLLDGATLFQKVLKQMYPFVDFM